MRKVIISNRDRRSGIDRREFSYSEHIPERRYVEDRRGGIDRRKKHYRYSNKIERRSFIAN
jgi:hypothetical protein